VTAAKIEINVLVAQAHFSTAQKLFASSSDPKKQACCISKYTHVFFSKTNIFSVGGTQGDS